MSNFTNNLKDGFTVTPNSILNSKTLKLEAIGLYTFLASKPTGWDFSYRGLESQLVESEKQLRRIVKLLVEAQLLLRIPSRKKGSFNGWEWILHPTQEQLEQYTDPALKVNGTDLLGTTENGNDRNGNYRKGKDISNTNPSNTKEEKKNKECDFLEFEKTDSLEVAEYLLKKILSFKPNFKQPNLNNWAKDIDKAMRLDKRTKQELIACINWIYTKEGSFWMSNILSGKKLREKFDTMEAQMLRNSGASTKHRTQQAIDEFARGA